jgi:hypothetical protein
MMSTGGYYRYRDIDRQLLFHGQTTRHAARPSIAHGRMPHDVRDELSSR